VGVTDVIQEQPIQLAGDEGKVWAAIGTTPVAVDDLASKLRLPARECLAMLTSLELAGLIECLVTGEVRRR
jgi:predicted Rossmann fold nucleotide-binding protein DprA/Smf involved in DNA uptake